MVTFTREELRDPIGPFRCRWYPADDYAILYYDDGSFPCPMEDCEGGIMEDTGICWPTGTLGYHHKCNCCGITFAVHKEAPDYLKTEPGESEGSFRIIGWNLEATQRVQDQIDEARRNGLGPRPDTK